MTLFPRFWSRPELPREIPITARLFTVAPESQLLGYCHWQPDPKRRPTLIFVHGLEGDSGSHYMLGIAQKAWRRGFNVVRLNQRNCGDTEHLSAGLFHSGLTADAAHVVHELTVVDGLPAIAVSGYSLGGNLALKLAGEYGAHPPKTLVAVAAVSPIVEIGECTRALERRENLLYQWNFVKDLKRRMRRKEQHQPGRFDLSALDSVKTVRGFDDTYTAPHFGFRGAEDYYYRASAMRVIDRIRVPALIITSEDDPFVPSQPFHDAKITGNAHIDLRLSAHGGHCGFVGARSAADDGYWAENEIVEFVTRNLRPDRG